MIEVKDELVKMAKEYGVHSGLEDGMNGKVKFIMRSDKIESDKVSNTSATAENTIENIQKNSEDSNEKESLLTKIKNIFK